MVIGICKQVLKVLRMKVLEAMGLFSALQMSKSFKICNIVLSMHTIRPLVVDCLKRFILILISGVSSVGSTGSSGYTVSL